MSAGLKWNKVSYALLLSVAVVCAGSIVPAHAAPADQHKAKAKAKKPELPPLPSGPTGPVQAMPLDSIAAVPPQVTYQNNQLTIVSPNSTLADILRAVRKLTGAEIEVPSAPERVVTHLGPGPAREVVADLLNGSRFNYVLLGSPGDDTALTRVVLVAKSSQESPTPNRPAPQPGVAQNNAAPPPPEQEVAAQPDANDAEATDENPPPDDNGDQPPADGAEAAEQQGNPQEQQGVKTPQQMLQEMQQRQMQLQQQQGQTPVPGSGMPPHPPQEQ